MDNIVQNQTPNVSNLLEGASPCNSKPIPSACKKGSSCVSIINSSCGKRIEFSHQLLTALSEPNNVEVLFNKGFLIIKSTDDAIFSLRKMGSKRGIYSAGLVKEISEKFDLDFSNRTCISFSDFIRIPDDTITAVAIQIN